MLRAELHQNRVATIAKVRSERQRRRKQNAATELLLKQNPFWKRFATAEQRAAMGSLSATSLAALTSWASTTEAACRAEAAAEEEELCRIHQELLGLVRRLAGEQKHDVHSERFPLTPDGLFAQIWEAVLVRDDLGQVLRASRAMRLEGVAQAAHDLAAGGEDTEEDDEDASHGQRPTEHPEPDHFTQPLKRVPKGHIVALAHAEEVLLDRTLVQFDAHYDELFLLEEQERFRTAAAAAGAEPEPGSLLPRRRRNAHHVDRKVLEARVSKRYEVFCLPEVVRTLFTKPAHEKDWEKLGQLAGYVQQAARGSLDEAAAASPAPFPPVQDLRTLWSNWGARPYSERKNLPHSCFLALCLDLGQVLWQWQCHRWTASIRLGWRRRMCSVASAGISRGSAWGTRPSSTASARAAASSSTGT